MSPELEAQVREIVAASKAPLDAASLRRKLKVKAKQRDAFASWVAGLGLVEWPGARYWNRAPEDVAEQAALAAAAVPSAPKKLIAAVTKGKAGYPKEAAEALLARLEDEGKLHRQPLLAASKYKLTSRLGEESRGFLQWAVRAAQRSLRALGEPADDRILAALAELEPQKGLLVTSQRLRRAVPGVSKKDFDDAAMRLYRAERVLLHRHSGPFLLPPEERGELIQSGDAFYAGVCWNTGEE